MYISKKDIKIFMSKIHKTDTCWIWIYGKTGANYGHFLYKNKDMLSHRFSWMIYNKKQIPKGFQICHHCDNPPCCNPTHLFLGTPKQNYQDMVNKGRCVKVNGINHGRHKLTENQILEIRSKYISYKYSSIKLSKEYNISDDMILNIIHNKNWKFI